MAIAGVKARRRRTGTLRRRSLIPSWILAWGLRLLVFVGITLLRLLADSVFPAIGFARPIEHVLEKHLALK